MAWLSEVMTDITTAILLDGFSRVRDELPELIRGLSSDQLLWRADGGANSIGWLAWHLTRVQDDHMAEVGDLDQVWQTQDFAARAELPYDEGATGYGQSGADVAAFSITDPDLLIAYQAAVFELTSRVLDGLDSDADYERIIDRRWDPPVTVAVRIASVLNDITQHLGQIALLRGMQSLR